jgi:PAS domain S-box-containing protein
MEGMPVLIVDDDAAHCDNLIDILLAEGYAPYAAGSGAAALRLAGARPPGIAILDLKLPDGPGTDLLARLKAAHPECICIIATAFGNLDAAVAALQEGAFHFLQKPLRPQELLGLLQRAAELLRLRDEKRQAERELHARNRELEIINARLRRMVESSRGLSACTSSGEIGPRLLEEFAINMAADGGSMYLCGAEGLQLVHALDAGHVPRCMPRAPQGSVFDLALRTAEPVFIPDITRARDIVPSGHHYRDASLLVFPLLDEQGAVMALIALHNKSHPPFTQQDLELGKIFVSVSSEALRATRAIEALKKSEYHYRLLAENAADVIWTADSAMVIRYVSHAVTSLLGYAPEELIGRPLSDILPGGSLNRIRQSYGSMSVAPVPDAGGRPAPQVFELEHLRKDGTVIVAELKVSLLVDAPAGFWGILGVSRDSSERRRAEAEREHLRAQLLQAQKMEGIGILAGGVAHDFNNLLTAIEGYVELTMMRLEDNQELYKNLETAKQAAMKAADLTRQLLLFSRKQPMEKKRLNLNWIIQNMLKMLRRLVPENISFDIECAQDLQAVQADAATIEQVILNLVINAGDAMPGGGQVTFRTRNRRLGEADRRLHPEARPGDWVCLSVSDTGVGMDEETLQHMFEPFFSTKARGSGTGLGLAVVYGIVSQHGGWISCDSTVGQGTTFCIWLPAAGAELHESVAAASPLDTLTGRGETILVVEDQQEVLTLCATALRRNGYAVEEARNAGEALRVFEAGRDRIRLVLSDVVLPDQTGIYVVETIRAAAPGMPIVLSSGYTDEKSQWPVIKEKQYPFLQKPYSLAELLSTVKSALAAGKLERM